VCGAGRVRRRVQDQHLRARRDRGGELLGRDLVALFRPGRWHDRNAVREQHHVGIRHPVGRGDDGFVARIEHRHAEVEDGLLGARGHEDLRPLVGDGVVALELRDDRVLELVDALDVGVAREAALDRLDAGRGDVRRRVEIGLTGAEADDILALGLQARGQRGDGEGGRGLDALGAAGDGWAHC
jgi:hypothetical protein